MAACELAGDDHRSLIERARGAVASSGAQRGLMPRTIQCYSGWVARFAKFAQTGRAIMQVETATAFLESIVSDEECAYSTQKQALNALAHFFKYVCQIEEPVFGVRLRKTSQRVPVLEAPKLFAYLLILERRSG